MNRREVIHRLLNKMADELLAYIKDKEQEYLERWVPAATIKRELEINFPAVPKGNEQYGTKGWLFAILARMLEDRVLVEYRKDDNNRAYYRSMLKKA